jgi:hypothetical protein
MDERRIFRACKPVRDACRLTAIPILIPLEQRSLIDQQSNCSLGAKMVSLSDSLFKESECKGSAKLDGTLKIISF